MSSFASRKRTNEKTASFGMPFFYIPASAGFPDVLRRALFIRPFRAQLPPRPERAANPSPTHHVGAKRRMPENAPQGQINSTQYRKTRNFSFHRRIRAVFPDVLRRAMLIRPFRAQVPPRPEGANNPSPTHHVGAKGGCRKKIKKNYPIENQIINAHDEKKIKKNASMA